MAHGLDCQTGYRAGDAGDGMDYLRNDVADFVEGFRLDDGDNVVGSGDRVDRCYALQVLEGCGNFFCSASIIFTVLSKSLSCLSVHSIRFLLNLSYWVSATSLAMS